MRYIETDDLENLPGMRLQLEDRFSFRCHRGLDCFNRCCRNLNLFLYPYDVIQLKHSLEINSDRFLDTYVDVVLREGTFFPEVLLKMADDQGQPCIFLSDAGCRVYESRPHTCRLFPVEQGYFFDARTRQIEPIHLFRPPGFCKGPHENNEWTPKQWALNQGPGAYQEMTRKWAEFKRLFQNNPWRGEGLDGPRAKMAFMAVYNVDRFRDFVFNSSFLKRYRVKSKLKRRIKTDDRALLEFGMSWIKFYLWGIESKRFSIR